MWRSSGFDKVAGLLRGARLARRADRALAEPIVHAAIDLVTAQEADAFIALVDWYLAAPDAVVRRAWAETHAAIPFDDLAYLLSMLREIREKVAAREGAEVRPAPPRRRPKVFDHVVGSIGLFMTRDIQEPLALALHDAANDVLGSGEFGARDFLDHVDHVLALDENARLAEWVAAGGPTEAIDFVRSWTVGEISQLLRYVRERVVAGLPNIHKGRARYKW